jgi:hypothetical protein
MKRRILVLVAVVSSVGSLLSANVARGVTLTKLFDGSVQVLNQTPPEWLQYQQANCPAGNAYLKGTFSSIFNVTPYRGKKLRVRAGAMGTVIDSHYSAPAVNIDVHILCGPPWMIASAIGYASNHGVDNAGGDAVITVPNNAIWFSVEMIFGDLPHVGQSYSVYLQT